LPLTTLGQETRWAYSTTPPSPHGADLRGRLLTDGRGRSGEWEGIGEGKKEGKRGREGEEKGSEAKGGREREGPPRVGSQSHPHVRNHEKFPGCTDFV